MSKQATTCPNCKAETYTRNNYFTGKLMVERDFTDEQHYFMEKLRLHNQRLHGSGIVCGLQIVQHDNPACRDRYVILQPGTAIDCCGKEILVTEPEVIDLHAFPELQELLQQNNDEAHTLQLRICYRECPTEDIPVLYDECGCDDTQCAPNRILESYRIELAIDPEIDAQPVLQPALDWASTVNIAHAREAVLHEASGRLYTITSGDQANIYQVSTNNLAIEDSFAINRPALAIAVAPDGNQLYLITTHADGLDQGNSELWVFDTSGDNTLSDGPVRGAEIPASINNKVSLACAPDGRLIAVFRADGKVRVWEAGVPDPAALPNAQKANIGANLRDMAVAQDGVTVYISEFDSGNLHQVNIDVNGLDPQVTALPGVSLNWIAMLNSSGPDRIIAPDHAAQTLHVIDPVGGSVVESASLGFTGRRVAVSEGGHWAYLLESDGTDNLVHAINLQRVLQGEPVIPGEPVKVGNLSRQLVLTTAGRRLYIPYAEDLAVPDAGGIAVLEITEQDCRELLCNINDCPDCETSDCLVLATMENYRPGNQLVDPVDPPPEPGADEAANTARIDNSLHRQVLPSTQSLAEAIKCILDNCCGGGGAGEQGPPGPPGQDGQNGLDGQNGQNGENGEDGEDGEDGIGIDTNLPHICFINWTHSVGTRFTADEAMTMEYLQSQGLVIGFDTPVVRDDLHAGSIEVLYFNFETECWCSLSIDEFNGLEFINGPPCDHASRFNPEFIGGQNDGGLSFQPVPDSVNQVNGVQLTFTDPARAIREITDNVGVGFIRVFVNGDFIRGRHLDTEEFRSGDFDHIQPWLRPSTTGNPNPDDNYKTGDGIEGGTFESWVLLLQLNNQDDDDNTGFSRAAEMARRIGITGLRR